MSWLLCGNRKNIKSHVVLVTDGEPKANPKSKVLNANPPLSSQKCG